MGALNKLSAAKVRTASKPGLYGDGGGLYLQVSAFDTKAWVFRFMLDGRPRKMGLGPIHTVTLVDARAQAASARRKLLDGIDPIEEREAARSARKAAVGAAKVNAAKARTFKQEADAFVAAKRASWKSAVHERQWISTFGETRRGKRVYPAATAAINDLPVSAIDRALVLSVIDPIWSKTPETASRVRGRIEAVLDFARVRGFRDGENPARWTGNLKYVLGGKPREARVKHHPALPYREMGAFMTELRTRPGVAARALEFTILTAVRTKSTRIARWSEIDAAQRLWVVPDENMKTDREFRVPLSDRALEILETLPRESEFIFPGSATGSHLSEQAMRNVLEAMRGKKVATVHGFRSTFRDWLAEMTAYPNELCEVALAHKVTNKVEAAYRRGDQMEKRRRLMADWADYCSQQGGDRGNVVPIREAER